LSKIKISFIPIIIRNRVIEEVPIDSIIDTDIQIEVVSIESRKVDAVLEKYIKSSWNGNRLKIKVIGRVIAS